MPDGTLGAVGDDHRMAVGDVTTARTDDLVELQVGDTFWERVFTVAPLVLVGTKEAEGWDFAPKHMAMPLGFEGFYCFVCTPRHATYSNLRKHPQFTVSFPGPEQIIESSLAAGGRYEHDVKPSLAAIPSEPARVVDGRVVAGCPLYLE
jgi:flavin reductase (DIM6/NTAB) family NADH-FMN oxidoreductase RutF